MTDPNAGAIGKAIMPLTDAEKRLLHAIHEGGRTCVIQKQRILCAGEFLPFMPGTALSLVGKGFLTFTEPKRLVISGWTP